MDSTRSARAKAVEWIRRYLPCELSGTVGEIGGAVFAYWITGSLAAAAVAGTVGATVGYYAAAYGSAVGCFYRADLSRTGLARSLIATALALRSLFIEFGPAEAIDSLVVRPLTFYFGPILLGGTVLGWIVAKILSDCIFYLFTIVSYERFSGLLAHRQPKEVLSDGSHHPATVT
ncbi:UNVERIFIED_CONTAM: hypothetical protein DES50_101831 [Williamsia faeni]